MEKKDHDRKYKEELKTLLTEYKLLQTKKAKVENTYDSKKMEFVGVVSG